MKRSIFEKLAGRNSILFLAGFAMAACFIPYTQLPTLRGAEVVPFLSFFLLAAITYAVAIFCIKGNNIDLKIVWGFAILFRILLLLTDPSLSDDVYRYIWDGHLVTNGLNPYSLPVDSPLLDPYSIPARDLVNNNSMASPYLPAAQFFFGLIYWIAPNSVKAFQIAAVILDFLTGWLVMDIMRVLKLPRSRVLIYLWNPLVIIEFANGAHIDALMLFLSVGGLWLLMKTGQDLMWKNIFGWGSVFALIGAVLTKAVPILLLPLIIGRWGWKKLAVFFGSTAAVCAAFSVGAGWGLSGPLNGTGVFGAILIYLRCWNYNSGLYHWLEVWLTGYSTPGAVPLEIADSNILLAKGIMTAALGASILASGWWAWRKAQGPADNTARNLTLLRLAAASFGAYLLFTTTIHPWYITIILPFLPFLLPASGENQAAGSFLWPWLYFSLIVTLSYTTYIDPDNLREFRIIRQIEYIPLFILLGWAALPFIPRIFAFVRSGFGHRARIKRR